MSLEHASKLVKQQTLTRDAFLGGTLIVSQPRNGFRAGLDSVLLGAAVGPQTASLLDLGAGAGVAALVALAGSPSRHAILADNDPAMNALAAHNIEENGMGARARVVGVDVTAPGRTRVAAGLAADHFEAVIANPPFFDAARGTAAAEARGAARQMPPAGLELWARAAATHCAPGGEAIFILPAARLAEILHAFADRFGAICVLPLCPRADEPATRILVRGKKGSRAPLSLLASRILHEPVGGAFRPEFDAILRGGARLDW